MPSIFGFRPSHARRARRTLVIMVELFYLVMALTCVGAIVMGIRALRGLKGGDDNDAFGPRQ